ncbi:hypothetical protein SAMN05660235_02297 [Sporolituus thermophilus DSM 23256]|uniref:Uncharacterized protein n=1 Tax=Sporolituus thermophilus DSM 23256 TaxID=1123285 RepID=A0A1G7MT98_9FIRM|nr:hypothetical protein SAMN05660235_02297 [Sporolituus thermophilus DSM 23256]
MLDVLKGDLALLVSFAGQGAGRRDSRQAKGGQPAGQSGLPGAGICPGGGKLPEVLAGR